MTDIKHDRYFLEIQDEADLQASLLSQSEIQLFSKALDFQPLHPEMTRLMAIKWRCAKWPALNSDDGEQAISECTEGSFIHKAHLNWKKKFLHFETFKPVAWGTTLRDGE